MSSALLTADNKLSRGKSLSGAAAVRTFCALFWFTTVRTNTVNTIGLLNKAMWTTFRAKSQFFNCQGSTSAKKKD